MNGEREGERGSEREREKLKIKFPIIPDSSVSRKEALLLLS
jgi:hypothetical protein